MQELPKHVGPFEVVSKLGHGGMGVVYKGYDRELDRHVAIKCLADQFADDESVTTRFLREARSVAALSHPNIVPVYTAGKDEDRAYFVMEYIEGESLADRLKRENPLPVGEAVRIVMETAEGLQAAHEAKLTHRDIKPSNLLLDNKGRVRIADFGIARIEGLTRLTATSGLVGTPGYISPEAIAGEPDDHRSDIFSLGVVFYEMLAGRAPFTQTSPVQMWRAAVEANYPDVREINAGVDATTRAIIDRMLAPKPDDRTQSCEQVIDELAQHFGREGTPIPTSSRTKPAAVERTQKLPGGGAVAARRKPGPAIGAVVALALVAIAAGATAYLTQFRDRGAVDHAASKDRPGASDAQAVTGKPETNSGNVVGWLLGGDDKASTSASGGEVASAMAGNRDTGSRMEPDANGPAPGSASQPTSGVVGDDPGSGRGTSAAADAATAEVAADTGTDSVLADNNADNNTDSGNNRPSQQGLPAADSADATGQNDPKQRSRTNEPAEGPGDDTALAAAPHDAPGAAGESGPGTRTMREPSTDSSASDAVAEASTDQDLRTASTKRQPSAPTPDKVVVMAVGDSTIAKPVESELENALRSSGHKILNEQFISGIGRHVQGDSVDMGPLRNLLRADGARILVLARVVPVGQRQLRYSGRSGTAYSSQINVRVYDLGNGTRLDGWQKQIEFTSLNATDQAKRAMTPYLRRLTAQLSRYRG